MGLLIWLGPYFQVKTLGHTFRPVTGLCVLFWVHLGVPKCPKQHRKTIVCLFWTISSTRMDLLIWLGAHFQAKTLGHTSRPLAGLCLLFWVHLGVPKCPQKTMKINCFLVVLDHLGLLIWYGLFSS
jgi:hypothetical protein